MIFLLNFEGIINPINLQIFERALKRAEKLNAPLIIQINTPGGLMETTQKIVEKILNSEVPTIAFVYPKGARAASAGTFVVMACHLAYMAPGTRIGAAHPVDIMGKKVNEKIINDTVSFAVSIARARKRNEKWAREAVEKSSSITALEAVEKKVVDGIATDVEDLLRKIDGLSLQINKKKYTIRTRNAKLIKIKPNWWEKFMKELAHPNVAYILFMIGVYGLIFEVTHPGAVLPGILGALSIILALFSFQVLSANLTGVLLLLLAGICFALEVYITSFGLLTVGGIISLLIGSLLLFKGTPFKLDLSLSIASAGITAAFIAFLGFLVKKAYSAPPATGAEGMLGKTGIAKTRITPKGGYVLVHGEIWKARSTTPLKAGTKVKITKIDGLVLQVEKEEQSD